MSELTREQKLNLIYRHTHPDYKGRFAQNGERAIMMWRGGTCLVQLSRLTDAEIADRLPHAVRKEAERRMNKR